MSSVSGLRLFAPFNAKTAFVLHWFGCSLQLGIPWRVSAYFVPFRGVSPVIPWRVSVHSVACLRPFRGVSPVIPWRVSA
jgi:hypothetical protein